MNLDQRINEVMEKTQLRINELNGENMNDTEILKDLQEKYQLAILESNEEQVKNINKEITDVMNRIARRKEVIEVLNNKDNQVIQNMVKDKVAEWLKNLDKTRDEGAEIAKDIKKYRDKLVEGLQKISDLRNESLNIRSSINQYNLRYLNDASRKELGINRYGVDVPELAKHINELLVESRHVYKR